MMAGILATSCASDPPSTSAPAPTLASTPVPTVWEQYTNPSYGYQLQIPTGWAKVHESGSYAVFVSPDGFAKVRVSLGSEQLSLASMLDTQSVGAGKFEVLSERGDLTAGVPLEPTYARFRFQQFTVDCPSITQVRVLPYLDTSMWVTSTHCEQFAETYRPIVDAAILSFKP